MTIKLIGGTYHLWRRVPKRFQLIEPRQHLKVTLRTDSEKDARKTDGRGPASFSYWSKLNRCLSSSPCMGGMMTRPGRGAGAGRVRRGHVCRRRGMGMGMGLCGDPGIGTMRLVAGRRIGFGRFAAIAHR